MPSFDVVSKVPWNEVDNALTQASKELEQRFDFKGTEATVEKTKDGLLVKANAEERAKAALVVLQEKLAKRKVSLKYLEIGKPETTGKTTRIVVKVKEGIEGEKGKLIVGQIKDAKLKVQASIQDSQVRVTGKNKDDLQATIALLRGMEIDVELQFQNFRD
jgi:uncharacterized protein YajQ (UPF0234 family)